MQAEPIRPLRVLVVDDHHDTVEITARVLRSAGHYVWTAESCAAALKIARTERLDVLVSDIGLPDGDGCQLLADLLAIYPVRAVAFTGYAMPQDRARFEQAGFSAFLTKPVELDDIMAAVRAAAG